ncbi:MAG: MarC family protein [Marinifilaceae bacterium]|jgi:multiple antibiotic resistance protein|nr:MarC family protein [Marinifilaceae bacterium]
MINSLNFVEILSAFIVMFSIIDITGSIPIFLSMKTQKKTIKAPQASLVALAFFIGFFFAGDALLRLFGVDKASFAVAGAFVIFILALEMILGVEIIKNESSSSNSSVVPVAFPLIAGPGALTALLSLRADYHVVNIMTGLVANIILAFVVLMFIEKIEKLLGKETIFIVRKFFGVILFAIAVKMLASNLAVVINNLSQ